MSNVTVPRRMFEMILVCAFRYALGRRTYIAGECAHWLTIYWNDLAEGFQNQVKRDIQGAIDAGNAGAPMDVTEWSKVLKLTTNGEIK